MFSKIAVQRIISLMLAGLVLAVSIYQGPELYKAFQKVQFHWAVAGCGCYFINYFFRASRIRTVAEYHISMWPDAVYSACLHGMATYLLPLRTGDLTLPVILNTTSGMGVAEGGRVLLKARLLDIWTLGVFTLTAALFLSAPVSPQMRLAWITTGTAMVFFPFIVRRLGRIDRLKRIGFVRRMAFSDKLIPTGRWEIFQSLGIWGAVGGCLYCTTRAIGLPLDMGGIWFLITIQLPLQLVPVQGFANTGNHEGGWVAALTILGFSASEGLAFALTSHALLLAYVLTLGPLAVLGRLMAGKRIPENDANAT